MNNDPAFYRRSNHYELIYVGPNGTTVQCFGYPPTTEDMHDRRSKNDRYCIQLVGDLYEVYDLSTLRKMMPFMSTLTVGVPKFTHEDPDAAIMWALMNV